MIKHNLQEVTKNGYYTARLPATYDRLEVTEWCNDTYGYNCTWVGNLFIFSTEKDRNWFILRWS